MVNQPSRILMIYIFVLSIFWIGTNRAHAAETLRVDSPSSDYRGMTFQAFRGLPRFGEPDTLGFIEPGDTSVSLQSKLYNRKAEAEQIGAALETHNYSLGLLSRLDFMRRHADCFKEMSGYQARTENCAGKLIDHHNQLEFWRTYIAIMAYALQPKNHLEHFCPQESHCQTTGIDAIYHKMENGGVRPLNEFEKRDFVKALMSAQYDSFEKYWRSMAFPQEAYFVSRVQLSDYDFDNRKFTFDFVPMNHMPSPNVLGERNNTFTSRMISTRAQYAPLLDFEKQFADPSSENWRRVNVDVPMPPDQARALLQKGNQNRQYYAVVRVKFTAPRLDPYNPLKGIDLLSYHYAENKVELFEDDGLTKKVAEIRLLPFAAKEAASNKKSEAQKYTPHENSRLLDHRFLSLLRYKKQNLLPSDIDKIAYSISHSERDFWNKYYQRVDAANRPMGPGLDEKNQESIGNKKRAAEDQARLSSVSWQDIGGLSAEQKQAFYNYMLGYDYTPGKESFWPDVLPSVNWGMNLATVFRKGHLPENLAVLLDAKDKELLQRFVSDIANSQNLEHGTLVFGLTGLSYDQNKKQLIINQNTWPFQQEQNIIFSDGANTSSNPDTLALAPARAQSRAVYALRSSDRPAGAKHPNQAFPLCSMFQARKSYDCVTSYTTFTPLAFERAYLALDRTIALEAVPLNLKEGMNIANTSDYTGWRVVVELSSPEMEVIPTTYTNPQTKEEQPWEAYTVFANVQRVLILDPRDEIVWSQEGGALARPEHKKTAETKME